MKLLFKFTIRTLYECSIQTDFRCSLLLIGDSKNGTQKFQHTFFLSFCKLGPIGLVTSSSWPFYFSVVPYPHLFLAHWPLF